MTVPLLFIWQYHQSEPLLPIWQYFDNAYMTVLYLQSENRRCEIAFVYILKITHFNDNNRFLAIIT